MKLYRARISGIPLTPREKWRKILKIILLVSSFIAVLGGLIWTGVFSRIFSPPAASAEEISNQQVALIAETGVKVFTSISPERGYDEWQLSLCSLGTKRFCTLINSGFGHQVWENAVTNNMGITNLSTHAIARMYTDGREDHQFWRVRYQLLSADGEKVHSAVVSVVKEEGRWKFNGFAFLPEVTPVGYKRGIQED